MENKAEILQKLYNIRAGLSAVSVQRDEIARREDEISKTKEQINSNYNAYVAKRQSLEKEIEETERGLNGLTSNLLRYETELYEKNNAKNPKAHFKHWKKEQKQKRFYVDRPGAFIFFFIGIALFIAGVILFISAAATGFEKADYHLLFIPCIYAGIPISIVCGIKAFRHHGVRFYSYSSCSKEDYERYYKDLEKRVRELTLMQRRTQLHLNTSESNLKNFANTQTYTSPTLQAKVTSLSTSIPVVIAYANHMYDVVVKEYGNFLSVSDWQNLDYIIYLFETSRADTIKESLILLDEMKRHDMLMKAMGHIASTIRAGFGELNSTMMRGFSMMSSQLESMSSQMDSIRSAQQNSNALLGDLGKKMDVYNALCAKANTTSETMMKDVDYIKSRLSR